jgi:hypothetical protein
MLLLSILQLPQVLLQVSIQWDNQILTNEKVFGIFQALPKSKDEGGNCPTERVAEKAVQTLPTHQKDCFKLRIARGGADARLVSLRGLKCSWTSSHNMRFMLYWAAQDTENSIIEQKAFLVWVAWWRLRANKRKEIQARANAHNRQEGCARQRSEAL